uniref:Cytochrome P450 76A1-like n=1 Tax=Nicotiana tabacum TaxID=4097 RepID=A0A1S4DNU2_TOBAC|nr:PREDICTED: cytochrome P450 76A1-like [Nicotiana tabacum]
MFIAASETTNSSSDWALTELLCNPESMARAKAEITEGVGNKKFEEKSTVRKLGLLHYMQAVVKETLRLHPPVPFLVPQKIDTPKTMDMNEKIGFTVRKLPPLKAVPRKRNIYT